MGKLHFATRVLGFVAEVGVVDWLHVLFGGDCFALGR
jgi:hypothetical protein